jgi:hypothetical protein
MLFNIVFSDLLILEISVLPARFTKRREISPSATASAVRSTSRNGFSALVIVNQVEIALSSKAGLRQKNRWFDIARARHRWLTWAGRRAAKNQFCPELSPQENASLSNSEFSGWC